MAQSTRKSATKRSAQKTAAKPGAKQGAKPSDSGTAARLEEITSAPLRAISEAMKDMPLSVVAGKLIEGRRKDLEAIVEANKKSYAGLQAVVQRQTAMLKDAIREWQSAAGSMSASPQEGIAKLDQVARQSFTIAIANIRELAEMSAKSQAEAFELVKSRIRENIEEVTALLQRK